jgi:hypothetical protein
LQAPAHFENQPLRRPLSFIPTKKQIAQKNNQTPNDAKQETVPRTQGPIGMH